MSSSSFSLSRSSSPPFDALLSLRGGRGVVALPVLRVTCPSFQQYLSHVCTSSHRLVRTSGLQTFPCSSSLRGWSESASQPHALQFHGSGTTWKSLCESKGGEAGGPAPARGVFVYYETSYIFGGRSERAHDFARPKGRRLTLFSNPAENHGMTVVPMLFSA